MVLQQQAKEEEEAKERERQDRHAMGAGPGTGQRMLIRSGNTTLSRANQSLLSEPMVRARVACGWVGPASGLAPRKPLRDRRGACRRVPCARPA